LDHSIEYSKKKMSAPDNSPLGTTPTRIEETQRDSIQQEHIPQEHTPQEHTIQEQHKYHQQRKYLTRDETTLGYEFDRMLNQFLALDSIPMEMVNEYKCTEEQGKRASRRSNELRQDIYTSKQTIQSAVNNIVMAQRELKSLRLPSAHYYWNHVRAPRKHSTMFGKSSDQVSRNNPHNPQKHNHQKKDLQKNYFTREVSQ
jgi:hypothetical protein